MENMWRPRTPDEADSYAIPPGHPSRQHSGMKSLGRDFNPMKFDFAPMRQFNPLKFEFDMVETNEPEDLMSMLPKPMGPERYVSDPLMGATSHQDVPLSYRLHSNAHIAEPSAPAIDDATMSLLDSLELKFAPSFSMDEVQTGDGMMSQVVDELLKPRSSHRPAVPSMDYINRAAVKEETPSLPKNHEKMTPEELRVMRNKAVQKRYRIRKKTQAHNQLNMFGARKAELAVVESKAPAHHIAVVDKLLRLRTLNKERDADIKRLRKVLADEKASSEVPAGKVVVVDGPVEEGDYCDNNMEVMLPRNVAIAGVAEACCAKMAESLYFGDKALHDSVIQRLTSPESPRLSTL